MAYSYPAPPLPSAFIWRRAHSLTGLWLVLFLIEHLLTNSQAALFLAMMEMVLSGPSIF